MTVSEQYKEYKKQYWNNAVSIRSIRNRILLGYNNPRQPRMIAKINIKGRYKEYKKENPRSKLSIRWFTNRIYRGNINIPYMWRWWDRRSKKFLLKQKDYA